MQLEKDADPAVARYYSFYEPSSSDRAIKWSLLILFLLSLPVIIAVLRAEVVAPAILSALFVVIVLSLIPFAHWLNRQRAASVVINDEFITINKFNGSRTIDWKDVESISYFTLKTMGDTHLWIRRKPDAPELGVRYFGIAIIAGEVEGTKKLKALLKDLGKYVPVKEILTIGKRT